MGAWEKSTPRVSVGVLHATIVKIIIYVFFLVYSIIGFPMYVGSWVRTQHTTHFFIWFSKWRQGSAKSGALVSKEETEAGGQSETPPGISRSCESDRRPQDCWRKQEGKERFWRVEPAKGWVFRRGEGGFGGRGEVGGEAGLFCEIQTSGLNIDPWQNTRANHDGLICALGADKTGTAKRLPAPRQAIPI